MEAIISAPPGEDHVAKNPTQAVLEVLPKSKFLQNVGIESTAPARSTKAARRVEELESQLTAERQQSSELRSELGEMKKQAAEDREAMKKQEEETEKLRKQGDEIHSLLRRLLGGNSATNGEQ